MNASTMNFFLSLLAALLVPLASHAFSVNPWLSSHQNVRVASELRMADMASEFAAELETPEETQERIKDLVEDNKIVLFMKGSKLFPQCGFSNTAVQILNTFNIDYHTVDVLADEAVRQGVKTYSQWPTIPQLYISGEFIGGCDIMLEMYKDGSLSELVGKTEDA